MIGSTLGRYRVVARLGQGGMGTVWKAVDTLDGRDAALKTIAPELVESERARTRFLREARAVERLDHPALARVLDVGEAGGTLYIAFALHDGESLAARLGRGPLPAEDAARIAMALADGLAHAHRRGVIHRDVTPSNVLVGRDGRVWLVDFGLALLVGHSRLTSADTVLGTLPYLAPEALDGGGEDPRADVYSLGAVLYEMLTGMQPFGADRREALVYLILNQPPVSPREFDGRISGALERVVMRALAKDPAERFPGAEDMLEALRSIGGSAAAGAEAAMMPADAEAAPALAGAGAAPPPAERPSRRRLLAVRGFEAATERAGDAAEAARLAAGWTEALCAALAQVPALDVLPPDGWADARRTHADALSAARACGAHVLLAGTMRRVGEQVRVSFSLVDVRDGRQIAGHALTRPAAELFRLEDELAALLRSALDPTPPPRSEPPSPRRAPDPAHHERYLQALGYLQRSDSEASIDAAIGLLSGIVSEGADGAGFHAALGRAYASKFDHTSELRWEALAAAACHRALEADPDSPEAMLALAGLHRMTGKFEEAAALARTLIARRGEHYDALIALALALEQLGRFEEAEDACRRAIALRPEHWSGFDRLGTVFFHQGAFALAIEPWRNVARLLPESARAHFRLAAAYFHADRFADALETYRRSIAIEPRAESWSGLGNVAYYLGRYDEAREAFERSVLLKPGQPLMWGNLAAACGRVPGHESRRVECLARAIALVRDHLDLNAGNAENWAWLATWLAESAQPDAARAAADRALQVGPSNATVLAQAGVAFELLGDRSRAIECIEGAVKRGFGVEKLRRDPDLEDLHADPAFRRLIGELRAGPTDA